MNNSSFSFDPKADPKVILTASPLTRKSTHPHEAIDFPQIKIADYIPTLKAAIIQAKLTIGTIKSSSEEATFENTIEQLEFAGELVDEASKIFFNQLSAETSDELQALANDVGPLLSEFSNDILLDEELFGRIQHVFESQLSFKLNTEQKQLLDNTYKDFIRNGAKLDAKQKIRLREIDSELAVLGPQYSDNLLKATNDFELVIENEADLKGLPESARASSRQEAIAKGKPDKWVFTLQYPSYMPFITYSDHRHLREKIWRASSSLAYGGKFDNQPTIQKLIQLRDERAKLLGFKTHAHFVLERRMAETPERVMEFLDKLLSKARPAAEEDLKQVTAYAKANGGPDQLMPWDWAYYSEKLKEDKFKFKEEELRPYFSLPKVIDGVFAHATKLYGLHFEENKNYPVYHKEVQVFEVLDKKGGFVGLLYMDLFPRTTKKGGAWMTNYKDQGVFQGKVQRPHVGIVCNFSRPLPDKPSLLTFREVETMFHEFGHALHGLLSNCNYRSLSGANVFWDFVELPSQIMENWVVEKEALDIFAEHYQTGEKIPPELAKKLKDRTKFLAGYDVLRQLHFALLDMNWHTVKPSEIGQVAEFEKKVTAKTRVLPYVEGSNVSTAFAHIFAGGYSAGYYSYKWAEVLDADAFEYFKEKGIFSPEVAEKFHLHILSRGGTEHPMELYKRFRGREPDPNALLRRKGLIN